MTRGGQDGGVCRHKRRSPTSGAEVQPKQLLSSGPCCATTWPSFHADTHPPPSPVPFRSFARASALEAHVVHCEKWGGVLARIWAQLGPIGMASRDGSRATSRMCCLCLLAVPKLHLVRLVFVRELPPDL